MKRNRFFRKLAEFFEELLVPEKFSFVVVTLIILVVETATAYQVWYHYFR